MLQITAKGVTHLYLRGKKNVIFKLIILMFQLDFLKYFTRKLQSTSSEKIEAKANIQKPYSVGSLEFKFQSINGRQVIMQEGEILHNGQRRKGQIIPSFKECSKLLNKAKNQDNNNLCFQVLFLLKKGGPSLSLTNNKNPPKPPW